MRKSSPLSLRRLIQTVSAYELVLEVYPDRENVKQFLKNDACIAAQRGWLLEFIAAFE